VLRARVRWARGRAEHRTELRSGRRLAARDDHAPIFVLGAPRSGTTLAYQLLVEGLDLGWLGNEHAARPTAVVEVERAAPPRADRLGSDFDSEHGSTTGDWGPSEAGEYWYRAFPRDRHQQGAGDATERRCAEVAAMVRAFADASGGPVVFKNTLNSLRVPVLARALPEARFVLVERDLPDNARSLLVGRARRGALDEWWSARPDGADALVASGADPAAQVVWQAREVTRIAREDLAEHAPGRWITIRYDELCDDPRGVLACTHEWLGQQGVAVAARDRSRIPERFDRRGGGALDPLLEQQLVDALREDAP
jgi:hypothetical protein